MLQVAVYTAMVRDVVQMLVQRKLLRRPVLRSCLTLSINDVL
jgi:hypothetical protein